MNATDFKRALATNPEGAIHADPDTAAFYVELGKDGTVTALAASTPPLPKRGVIYVLPQ